MSNVYSGYKPIQGCYMIVHQNSTLHYSLPCYPEEISDSISVNWSDNTIVNRGSPLSSYVGTGFRSVSFSMTLHRDMDYPTHSIEQVLKALRSSTYPRYGTTIKPPVVTFAFGEFKVKGIVRNVSVNWKKPIIENKYYMCDVSVQIDEPVESTLSVISVYTNNPMNPLGIKEK